MTYLVQAVAHTKITTATQELDELGAHKFSECLVLEPSSVCECHPGSSQAISMLYHRSPTTSRGAKDDENA